MHCQTVVAPPGGRPASWTLLSNEGTATAQAPVNTLAGRPGHLDHGFRPCLLTPAFASPASVFGSVLTAPWDANSTSVCWACQEGIPIYCISVLTLGMPASKRAFSTALPSRLMPASPDGGKPCVSTGIPEPPGPVAKARLPAPWRHRYPRRFHGVRCG
jgi:hypothetical protein